MIRLLQTLVFCLMSLTFVALASAQDWTSLTDEIEIDYNTSVMRIFVVIKSNSPGYNHYKETLQPGIKMTTAYIRTLTVGSDKKKLGEVMKARPALAAKIQKIVEDTLANISVEGSYLQETSQYCRYYTFDLKRLLAVVPDLNLPKPDDMVQ